MRIPTFVLILIAAFGIRGADAAEPRQTAVSIHGDAFHINGRPTYAGRTWKGHKIEGLLLNSAGWCRPRLTISIQKQRRNGRIPTRATGTPERNTREFVAAMPQWRKHGLLAITVNLQGGSPKGYSREQPWHNSAFNANGSLAR